MLSEKLKLLSDRINESVFDTTYKETTNDTASDDETTAESTNMNEEDDDDDDQVVPSDLDGDVEMDDDEEGRVRRVEALMHKITSWKRPFPEMH